MLGTGISEVANMCRSQIVLCVDYTKGSLTSLKLAIARAGYTVVVADTLRYATAAIGVIAFDFILLNDKLPQPDAQDIVNTLKQVSSGTQIIVFSHRTAAGVGVHTAPAN